MTTNSYAQKTAGITNLDATPALENTAGRSNGNGYLQVQTGTVTPTTGELGSTSTLYAMLRLPTSCYLKQLDLHADTALDSGSPSLTVDVGSAYSDSTVDGTSVANQGVSISATSFASAAVFAQGSTSLDINALSAFGSASREKRLWDALGLSSDPGGFIDVVVKVHAAANTAASHPISLRGYFVAGP